MAVGQVIGRVSVKVIPDTDNFRREAQTKLDGIEKRLQVEVDLIPNLNGLAAKGTAAKLGALTRPREVKINPVLDVSATAAVGGALAALSGARLGQGLFQSITSELMNLDKAVPKISAVTLSLVGLAAAGLSSASNIFSLGTSIAQMAPALLVLPGVFAGMAIGAGAFIAVIKDFNDYLPDVTKKFTDLQSRMSAEFWSGAEAPIRNMVNTLFPAISSGLVETSAQLAGFTTNLTNAFAAKFDGGVLTAMFDRLNESIAIFSGYGDSIATIFRVLGGAGSRELPVLATWFGTLTERFANFLRESEKTGALQAWIDRALFQFGEFGRVLGGLGSILGSIGAAAQAAGGSTLTSLADGLEAMAAVASTPAFQTGLTDTLKAAHEAMGNIATVAGPAVLNFFKTFATTLQTVMPIAGTAIGTLLGSIANMLANPAVQSGFTQLVQGISGGIMALAPAFDVIGPKLGAVMSLIGTMATQFGGVIATLVTAVGPGFTAVVQAIQPLVELLGPILSNIITLLAPLFETMSANLVRVAEAAAPLIAKFGEFANQVLPVLVPVLQFVADLIGTALVAAINGVMMVFDGLMQMFSGFGQIIDGFKQIFSGDFIGGIQTIFAGLGNVIMGALTAIAGAIWAWMNGSIIGFFRGGLLKVVGLFKSGGTSIKTVFMNALNALKNGAGNFANGLKNIISGMWNIIKGLFSGAWAVIKGVVLAGWNVIRGNFTGAKDALVGIINGLSSALGNIFIGMIELLSGIVGTIWGTVEKLFGKGITAVKNVVTKMPGKIKSAFGEAGTILKDIGKKIIDGLLDGLKSGYEKVKGLLGKITDKIPDWKGPEKKDKKLLRNAGQKIIQGLIDGFEDKMSAVKSKLNELTEFLPRQFDKLPNLIESRLSAAFKKGGKKAATALANDLRGKYNDVLKMQTSVLAEGKVQTLGLQGLEALHARLSDRLKEELSTLEQMKEAAIAYAAQVADAIVATGDLTQIGRRKDDEGEEFFNFNTMMEDLTKARDTAASLGGAVQQLIAQGVNSDIIQQIVGSAPDVGLATAQAILDAGPEGIAAMNAMQASLAAHAANVGALAAQDAHQSGIDIQQGIVDGLTAEVSAVEQAITKLARKIIRAFRRALKINSPSRVMASLSRYLPQGIAKGINDNSKVAINSVQSLATGLADAVTLDASGRSVMDSLLTGMESRYGKVSSSLSAFGDALGIDPKTANGSAIAGRVGVSMGASGSGETRVLNYYAAPNSSLDSNEDLFAAANRARFVF